jgi:hydrogenase maturation protease
VTGSPDGWRELERRAAETITLRGVQLARGSRVRLRPRRGADPLDLALDGRLAVVDAVEEDAEGRVHLMVGLADDPAWDLGAGRQIGHRFFVSPDEVEPVSDAPLGGPPTRILVAGIGNVFLGDDGFGVAVATELQQRPLPAGVRVVDFGIRGMDLVYALQDDPDAVVLVDAAPRGELPGTLSLIEPEISDAAAGLDTHGMDPVSVLALARLQGAAPGRILLVACEPGALVDRDDPDIVMELSEPVAAAVPHAVAVVGSRLT